MKRKASEFVEHYKLDSYSKWENIANNLRDVLHLAEKRCGYCWMIADNYCNKCPMFKAKVCGYNFTEKTEINVADKKGYKHKQITQTLVDAISLADSIKQAISKDLGIKEEDK